CCVLRAQTYVANSATTASSSPSLLTATNGSLKEDISTASAIATVSPTIPVSTSNTRADPPFEHEARNRPFSLNPSATTSPMSPNGGVRTDCVSVSQI